MSETYRGICFAYRNRFLIFLTIMVLKFADYCQKYYLCTFISRKLCVFDLIGEINVLIGITIDE